MTLAAWQFQDRFATALDESRVLAALRAHADCRRVLVAINPDNARSQRFFTRLGPRAVEERNDDDPVFELVGDGCGASA